MHKLMLAAAGTLLFAGAAVAQEAPYTVHDGQVTYPSEMQWIAPTGPSAPAYEADVYSGSSSALPGSGTYEAQFEPASGPMVGNTGIFVFDGENLNNDQDYSGR